MAELNDSILYSLLPVIIWTLSSFRTKVYIEPVAAMLYKKHYSNFGEKGFKEIRGKPMKSVERYECIYLLTLMYLRNVGSASSSSQTTFIQYLKQLVTNCSDPPIRPL